MHKGKTEVQLTINESWRIVGTASEYEGLGWDTTMKT